MKICNDLITNHTQMNLIEKYEKVINYLYPIIQNIPRKHGIVKKQFIDCLMKQIQLFNEAGKSNQISKMYLADAGLSNVRFYLRFMTNKNVKALTTKQQSYTQKLISDCISLMDNWISHKKVKEDKISP
jgi:hypothetical protein